MLATLALLLLVQADDHARDVVKRMTFPDEAAVKKWTDQGPEHQRLVDVLLKRENWVSAVKTVEEKLGPIGDAWTIEVALREWNGTTVAMGDRVGDRAQVRFNMRKLGDYERKMDGFRKQDEELRKKGKRLAWKVPPIRYERILHHELTHILQGETKSPGWFHEGLASWIGNDMSYVIAFGYLKKPVQAVDVDLSADADDEYGRGMMFFKWLESKNGQAGIKKLFRLTVVDGGDWKKALEEVTGLKWAGILEAEREWSERYCKSHAPGD